MQGGRGWLRLAGSIAGLVVLPPLGGCGSGGAMPQTGGVDPGAYMARFSGRWAFDDDVSEDPSQIIPPGTAQRAGGGDQAQGPVGPPRGGGVGDPRGRRGRRPRGRGFGPDTAAIRTTFDAFRSVPDEFSLTVNDSLLVTTWAPGQEEEEVRVRVAGDGVSRVVGEQRVDVSASWEGGRLRIERSVPGGGTVVDLVEAVPERPRLLVTRRVEGLGAMMAEVRFAFDRVQE